MPSIYYVFFDILMVFVSFFLRHSIKNLHTKVNSCACKQTNFHFMHVKFSFHMLWCMSILFCNSTTDTQPPYINSPILQFSVPLAIDSGEAKIRTASWEKMSTNKCRAIRIYTWAYFRWPKNLDKMTSHWNTQYNNITIYIHNRSIYFEIITCIILGLVISNVFACKTNSVFSDCDDSCVTGKHNRMGEHVL